MDTSEHGATGDDAPSASAKDGAEQAAASRAIGGKATDTVTIQAVTINRPRSELYAFWRDFSRLPSFMDNVERVDVLDDQRSHWVVKAPAGAVVEWDALIVEERKDELLAWRSTQDSEIVNSGRIEFKDAPEGRGTQVTAAISYDPPLGPIGKVIAKLFQREPAIQARRDLRRFKQLMETGEIATSARTLKQLQEETE